MIPLSDNVPRVHPPIMVLALIAVNVLAFLYELTLPHEQLMEFFYLMGVVPARFADPNWARMVGYPQGTLLPLATYMFLHSGWLHLILNMWMLWIFADNIEDVTGHGRFLVFYMICGLAALGAHLALNSTARIPIVGASGAIAGVKGAYFVLYPHGRVNTLIPIFFIPIIVRIPAAVFLGIWMALQILAGMSSSASGQVGGVAWWAHVGGFLTGALLIRVFRRADRCYYCYDPARKHYDKMDED